MARVAFVAFLNGARAAVLPDAFLGTWSPVKTQSTVHAILGPVDVPHLTMAKDESNGDFWMSVIQGQVFRTRDDVMQYCFAHVATSPFAVDTVEDNLIRYCYKTGDRMASHKVLANGSLATGCDAAKIDLELRDDGLLELSFYMSPPVLHASALYERTGDPPAISYYILSNFGGPCDPLNPGPPTAGLLDASPCPILNHKRQQAKQTSPAVADKDGIACRQYASGSMIPTDAAEKVDVRLQYAIPEKSCWPCNVSYSVSAAIAEDEYVAVGFKGMSYRTVEVMNVSRPAYFGMTTDKVDAERTSRAIVLGYAGSSGSCVREMKAEKYVGTPSDVQGNPNLIDESVERVNGRTVIRFTIEQHVGRNDSEISDFFYGEFISARTMWAIGAVDGSGCGAEPQFHRARGLSPLSWFDQNPNCTADLAEFGFRVGVDAVSV